MTLSELAKKEYEKNKGLQNAVKLCNDWAETGFTDEDLMPAKVD